MDAGRFDRRIRIERSTAAYDALNNPVLSWAKLAEVYASKQDVRDSERIAAKQLGAEIGTRFQIRWAQEIADLNPTDRLIFDCRVYEIVGVKEMGRREGLEITAIARPDQ